MQLSGKRYFGKKEDPQALPEGASRAVTETVDAPDGLDALREAVLHKHTVPAWMSAAGHIVVENRKHFIAAASVLVIGTAVYLNWALYNNADRRTDAAAGTVPAAEENSSVESAGASDGDVSYAVSEDSVLSGDDYFAVSLINRQRARDEAIEVLQNVADGAENLTDVREDALAGIAQIAADIENESAIESLVKGKGFDDCIAVISGENANVIVKTAALLPNELAQIQEIVYETAGILPANVKIIEK